MARRGGYQRSTNEEWLKTSQQRYGEAIISAKSMGQELTTWISDAISHHVYHCERLQVKERYDADCRAAMQSNAPTPDPNRYTISQPKPTITRSQPGGEYAAGPKSRPR